MKHRSDRWGDRRDAISTLVPRLSPHQTEIRNAAVRLAAVLLAAAAVQVLMSWLHH